MTYSFLQQFLPTLEGMSEAEFMATRQGLLSQLTREDKQLKQIARRYWTEIDRKVYQFDTRKQMIEAVENTTQLDLVAFYKQLVSDEDAAALLVYSAGNKGDHLALDQGPAIKTMNSISKLRNQHTGLF